jgi:hypothetical protein
MGSESVSDSFDYASIPVVSEPSEVDRLMGGDGIAPACILATEWRAHQISIGTLANNAPALVPAIIKPVAIMHQ